MNIPYMMRSHKQEDYLLEVLRKSRYSPTARHLKIEADKTVIEGDYIAAIFSNTHSLLNIPVYENVSLSDSQCELMLIKDYSRLKTIAELFEVLRYQRKLNEMSFVECYQAEHFQVEMDAHSWTPFCLDGEQCRKHLQNFEVAPLAKVRVMKGNSAR